MPAPPPGRIYEVWLEHGTAAPQPTDALFSVTSPAAGSVGVPGDLHGVSKVLVTDEPLGGSLKPTRSTGDRRLGVRIAVAELRVLARRWPIARTIRAMVRMRAAATR